MRQEGAVRLGRHGSTYRMACRTRLDRMGPGWITRERGRRFQSDGQKNFKGTASQEYIFETPKESAGEKNKRFRKEPAGESG